MRNEGQSHGMGAVPSTGHPNRRRRCGLRAAATGLVLCASLDLLRAAEPAGRVETPEEAAGGLAATNTATRRCAAAAFFRKTPSALTADRLPALVAMLADDRRVIVGERGFTDGLPVSPAGEAARTLEALGAAAVDPLVRALGSSNAAVRVRAAAALGRIGDASALPALARLMSDADRPVSLAASDALARFGTNAVVLMRQYLAGDPPANADRALWLLGEMRDADSVSLFLKYIAGDDERARVAAGAALARLGTSGARLLLDEWPRADTAERERIVRALDKLRTPAAFDHLLLTALGDRSERLRGTALSCLPAWDDPVAPVALLCALRDGSATLRDQVRPAFALMGTNEARIVAAYLNDDNPAVWQAAAIALTQMNPVAVPVLFEGLRDVNRPRDVRRRIAWVLLTMGNVRASYEDSQRLWIAAEDWELLAIFAEGVPETLADAALSRHPAYRAGALTTMAVQKLRGAETFLLRALDDPDPDVVQAARRGLAGQAYAFSSQLEDVVQHGSVRASRAAAAALADIGYQPRSQAMTVEFNASRGGIENLVALGGVVPTHLQRRLERSTEPAEIARLALDLARALRLVPPDARFAVDNVVVRQALSGTNRPARLQAMQELAGRPNLLLPLALDPDTNVAASACRMLGALPPKAGAILRSCLDSGNSALADAAMAALRHVEPAGLSGFDWLLHSADTGLCAQAAALFAVRGHVPSGIVERVTMAVRNRDWPAALACGAPATAALRDFVATADPAVLPGLFDALAAADADDFAALLAEAGALGGGRAGELAWPAISRSAARLRPHLLAMVREGELAAAVHAARLLERLAQAPAADDPSFLLHCAAAGRLRDLDDRRDEAARLFLREVRETAPARRLRGAVWLSLLQREPAGDLPFSPGALVKDHALRLASGDPAARTEAAVLLAQLGTNAAPAVPALIKALADNTRMNYRGARSEEYAPVDSVGAAAAMALGVIGDAAVTPLLDVWNNARTPEAERLAAARALALLRDPRCAAAQTAIVREDARKEVRIAAMKSLAANDPKGAVRLLLRTAARADDATVFGAALQALRSTGAEANPQLVLALHDEDSAVQETALGLLTERADPAAFDIAVRLAQSTFPGVRSQAAKYFGRLADPRAVETLAALLHDTSPVVQWNACEALGRVGRPAAGRLVALLADPDEEIRVRAAMLLRNIAGEDHGIDAAAWRAWLDAHSR